MSQDRTELYEGQTQCTKQISMEENDKEVCRRWSPIVRSDSSSKVAYSVGRECRGCYAPTNLPKSPLLATKWAFFVLVGGLRGVSSSKKIHFWDSNGPLLGGLAPPIDLGYEPDCHSIFKHLRV